MYDYKLKEWFLLAFMKTLQHWRIWVAQECLAVQQWTHSLRSPEIKHIAWVLDPFEVDFSKLSLSSEYESTLPAVYPIDLTYSKETLNICQLLRGIGWLVPWVCGSASGDSLSLLFLVLRTDWKYSFIAMFNTIWPVQRAPMSRYLEGALYKMFNCITLHVLKCSYQKTLVLLE